ncbi:Uncharacterized protein BM_BM8992 [Brugia malayi]|uniref:Bm8992 n=1 Tax=Brugia malayi TaxID=6279 RepID=A0A0K0JXQ5_BRUMA|nr:Uncharacterized protein BM_BM8992 [Brugia malayi]CRZ23110.1 Bm8992 [Brugia malayi]VIO99897.1 Uncharacterized protein BM_BM8992 [Brugia malayi]
MDNIEGSGITNSMIEWSEDLVSEGSGSQNEGSGDMEEDQEDVIAPIITSAEDGRHTELIDRIIITTYQGYIFCIINYFINNSNIQF